ncbi:sterol desaturase-related protein [Rhodobacterales bacterium HTCC2150]|nr:sterol desaturase-related protein [Rhodobacterales bacterium HTCC2150] [Rhodobacteraceae bacterium HTCC2150]
MENSILASEANIRLSVFLGVLTLMAVWEFIAPARRLEIPRFIRWSNNLGLVVVDTILVRLLFPILAVGLAQTVNGASFGLIPYVNLPMWLGFILAFLILDLVIYLQHVMFHFVPALWRLHRVHHSDVDFDVTTALRFHPIEIIMSMVIKLAVIAALGPVAVAVMVFEVVLNASAMFNHSNIRLPRGLDRIVRLFLVTPDMHRVHHSVHPDETNSNFGFNLPWWDFLMGTYRAQPRDGHETMDIGINRFRSRRDQWLDYLLVQPLRRLKGKE